VIRFLWVRVLFGLALYSSLCYSFPPRDFLEAKKFLKTLPYESQPTTLYCNACWTADGRVISGCPEGWTEDDCKLEWDHIVPASLLGVNLPCWQENACPWNPKKNKRSCCQEISPEFALREANVYNILPVLKKINRARSNFLPGIVYNRQRSLELCGMWIDPKTHTFEPPDHLKGRIARIYLHMYQEYRFPISQRRLQIIAEWDRKYPANFEEKRYIILLNKNLFMGQNRENI